MKIVALVVAWNSEETLGECLGSLFAQTRQPDQVVVVDNGSVDASASISRMFPVTVVDNSRNLGFTRAVNLVWKCMELGSYLLLCNPDVSLDKTCLGYLEEIMDANDSLLAVGPLLYRVEALHTLSKDSVDTAGLRIRGVSRAWDIRTPPPDTVPIFVDGLSGACMLIRRTNAADLFDSSFFAYKEDVDLALRAREEGRPMKLVPRAVGYHVRRWREGQRGSMSSEAKSHSLKNRWLLLKKHARQAVLADYLYNVAVTCMVLVTEPKIVWSAFKEWRAL